VTVNWRDGLTRQQIRDAEMRRGTEVLVDRHGAELLEQTLAERFDPDWKPTENPHLTSGRGAIRGKGNSG
jgi:hypothetical protein